MLQERINNGYTLVHHQFMLHILGIQDAAIAFDGSGYDQRIEQLQLVSFGQFGGISYGSWRYRNDWRAKASVIVIVGLIPVKGKLA